MLNFDKKIEMKRFVLMLLLTGPLMAQQVNQINWVERSGRPKLVVGIIVDQMRYDYLSRFAAHYGEGGFKRLMREGFNCTNGHYNYIPTKTAVGHASVFTGTTGSVHGVIANDWFDRKLGEEIYCVDDFSYKAVGTDAKGEQKSPHRMKTSTLTDELKLAQQMKSKTISIGIKDRSSVLPGGHTADAAYWFLGKKEGKFLTSSYYMEELPQWVKTFNSSGLVDDYMQQSWETLKPLNSYVESLPDDNPYEEPFSGNKKAVFPYKMKKLAKKNGHYDMIKSTPFGNNLLVAFAKKAIEAEQLGARGYTDFLTLSFSSPDYIGHQFGVDSKEVQDTYVRLDLELEDLLNYLDQNVGTGQYTLFLTADHAAVPVPNYLKDQGLPGGYFDEEGFEAELMKYLEENFGSAALFENFSNFQIFLDNAQIDQLGLDRGVLYEAVKEWALKHEGISRSVTRYQLETSDFQDVMMRKLQNGFNQKLSGDIVLIPQPNWIIYEEQGSTHGSGYTYDTHVPIIFYGKGVRQAETHRLIEIIDIAPTMSNLLEISFPNGSTGKVIGEVLDKWGPGKP